MPKNAHDDYEGFVAKFKPKKTTDDCYTPPHTYEAVAEYVAKRYGLDRKNFARPFYPSGDYQAEHYAEDTVVVDNPPFSIIAQIIDFYNANKIKFFLFAPHLTIIGTARNRAAAVLVGYTLTYENGAAVNTSFVTNLESCVLRSAPKLYAAIKAANELDTKKTKVSLPKYEYPPNLITAPMISRLSRNGIDFELLPEDCAFTRCLDAQKTDKKQIYGSGYLISHRKRAERERAERERAERERAERERAERERAERERAERWELSEREMAIIDGLRE